MRGCLVFYTCLVFLTNISCLVAQNRPLSSLRTKTIFFSIDKQLLLDTLPILPGTISIKDKNGNHLPNTSFIFFEGKIKWDTIPATSLFPISISYRIAPFAFSTPRKHLDTLIFAANKEGEKILNPYAFDNRSSPLLISGISSNGSFSRSLAFGNNQDLVLNSRFNLQLAGLIGDIELNAAITDENIPIQPEGNTQDLREFDRIFISLKKDETKLIAGDYELNRPKSYFINYFKKLQGISIYNSSNLTDKFSQQTDASLAISRGKFARNFINQQEGNQGPYQLRGAENERFIIVLSGTEKVYLDGRLLERGIDQDYIIDYNRGEVTFTNRRLITKDSRIIVEFEYTDQQYLRTLTALNSYLTYNDKLQLNVFFFSQQDSKAPSRTLQLTEAEKRALQQSGDNLSTNLITAIDTLDEITATAVTYYAKDTLVNCTVGDSTTQIFVINTANEIRPALSIQFSFVGDGNGDYVLDNSKAANERVFKWVAPDPLTCIPRGNYSPSRPLIAPQQHTMTALSGSWQLSPNNSLNMEMAWSKRDLNRFSSLDQDDDNGMAFTVNWQSGALQPRDSTKWALNTKLLYEYKDQFFQPLNPYRNQEFLRDWSISDRQNVGTVNPANEHLLNASLQLSKWGIGSLNLSTGLFNRSGQYQGLRQTLSGLIQSKGWIIQTNTSYLTADTEEEQRSFFRPNIAITKNLGRTNPWQVSLSTEIETNRRLSNETDTLSSNSFGFNLYKFALQSPETARKKFQLSLSHREDFEPSEKDLVLQTKAIDLNVNGETNLGRRGFLRGNFNYRNLEVKRTANLSANSGETFLGRLDNRLTFWKGGLRTNATYELGSGQEPRREFTFIRVARGEGTHIWLDSIYNNDGIVQANEMEIAPFQDRADFVKVATFSNEFIRTDYVNFNQSVNLTPKAVWFNTKGVRKFLSRFALQSNLRIARKTQKDAAISIWNPFELPLSDSSLISINSGTRHLLFFNRGNSKFDFQFGLIDNRNKFLQTTGFESRSRNEQFLRSRWNFTSNLGIETEIKTGENTTLSELAANRNFTLQQLELSGQLNYLINASFRVSGNFKWQQNENTITAVDPAFSTTQEFKLESVYNQAAKMSIRFDFSFINVNFKGDPNTPVGFAILNGLQNGQNLLWHLNLDRQLSNNLQMSIGYEGRKTGIARIVHVGRAQITALF